MRFSSERTTFILTKTLYEKYQLFYDAVNDSAKLDELVSTYLQSVTVNSNSRIDVGLY